MAKPKRIFRSQGDDFDIVEPLGNEESAESAKLRGSKRIVKNYMSYVSPLRENYQPEWCKFDMNMFENLIDCWTPKDEIMLILQADFGVMDKFCRECYNMDYEDTYRVLSSVTNAYMRKTIKGLSSRGNSTALAVATKHFMGLNDNDQPQNIAVTFVNDLKEDE